MTDKKTKKLENDLIEIQGPTNEDIIDMKVESRVEEEKEKLKEKMDIFIEKKANTKALALFEEEKKISNNMQIFKDEQTQLKWMFDQNALPEGDSAGQVMMKKMIGKELGLNTYQSITGLAFIKGKLCIWGKVFVGLITSAGYKISFEKWDTKGCKCTISKGDDTMTDTYTIGDAKNAGLYPSNAYSPWTKHTKKMLAYKVINNISSFLCPHIIGGAMIADDAREELKGSNEKIPVLEGEIEKTLINKFKNND